MMHKRFLLSVIQKTAFWGIMGLLLLVSPDAFATSGNTIFTNALNTLYSTFTNVRTIVYVVAGFGLIGVSVAAIAGKFPWQWLAMISVALFTLAMAEKIILYFTNPNLGSTPHSDFTSSLGDDEFKLDIGNAADSGDFESIAHDVHEDSAFISSLGASGGNSSGDGDGDNLSGRGSLFDVR